MKYNDVGIAQLPGIRIYECILARGYQWRERIVCYQNSLEPGLGEHTALVLRQRFNFGVT